jgi:hypothetical protein
MSAQGQTFFAASGDNSTWTKSGRAESWPADDAYVISVGGTDLVTSSAAGPWKSETAWVDSGGGISKDSVATPAWQLLTGVITSTNGGSTTYRNGPDVSANANFTFYTCDDQGNDSYYGGKECGANVFGGTSFAAPMWAGYIALLNQQLASEGQPNIGFFNPAIYPLGLGSGYSSAFHDVTSGTSGSYSANAGYDLVTGWGSPNGTGLISALDAATISVSPTTGTTATSFGADLAYPGFDGTATVYYALGSATPTSLGTCTETSSVLNSCTYTFTGSKIGPGPYNVSGQLVWVEVGTGTTSSYTSKTTSSTPITIVDTTTTSGVATPSSILTTGSTSILVTVADSVTSTFTPTNETVTLKLGSTTLTTCTLSAGTCTATVNGSALAIGSNSITLSYPGATNYYDASSGTVTVNVSAPASNVLTFTSVSHNFGQVAVGTAASAYGINIKNTGSVAYPFSLAFTPANGFTSANNCGSSIAAGATCELVFHFTPTSTAPVSATWSLASENGFGYTPSNGGTLTGSGTNSGGVSLTTNGHNFGTVTVGTTSPTYGTVLSNSTTSPITLTLGSVSSPFASITNCTSTLAAGASCNLDFTFTPTTTSEANASFAISATSGGSPVTITANGVTTTAITLSGN